MTTGTMARGGGLGRLVSWPHLAAAAAMLGAAALAIALAPAKLDAGADIDLDALVPKAFGDWRMVPSGVAQVDLTPRRDGEPAERTTDDPYDQTVMRTYVREDGTVVMLALAYGQRQRQEVKIHRPELCYAAQGFAVRAREAASLDLRDGQRVAVTRLLAQGGTRAEPVTYWIRIGGEITRSAWQSRLAILREGLQGRVPDGVLVRVSSAHPRALLDQQAAYRAQAEFLRELLPALEPRVQRLLLGPAASV